MILVNRFLFAKGALLPGFLTAMFGGILLTNLAEPLRCPVSRATVER